MRLTISKDNSYGGFMKKCLKSFLIEITLKENWKKAVHIIAPKDISLSRPFEKIEWVPFLLAAVLWLTSIAVIWAIFRVISYLIKLA